jgi:hypothetical protein
VVPGASRRFFRSRAPQETGGGYAPGPRRGSDAEWPRMPPADLAKLSSLQLHDRHLPPLISARSGSEALRGRQRLQVGELLMQETIEGPDEYTYHCPPEHDGETLRMGKRRPSVTAREKIASARTSISRSPVSPGPAPSLPSSQHRLYFVRRDPYRHELCSGIAAALVTSSRRAANSPQSRRSGLSYWVFGWVFELLFARRAASGASW